MDTVFPHTSGSEPFVNLDPLPPAATEPAREGVALAAQRQVAVTEPVGIDQTTVAPEDFVQELCDLVVDLAPRMFAVVQLYKVGTEEADGRVAAWGMAYEDGHADVIGVDGGLRLRLGTSPERATRWFARQTGITARLVWLEQARGAALNASVLAA